MLIVSLVAYVLACEVNYSCDSLCFSLLVYVKDLQMFTIYCFVIRVVMGTGSGGNITATYTYIASMFTGRCSMFTGR